MAERWQERARQPLAGWFGHRAPFDFAPAYEPAPGIARFLAGTPAVLGLKALEVGVGLFAGVDLAALRAKSMRLTQLLIELVESRCAGLGIALASPREPDRRGSQVAFRHPEGYAIMQALIARGIIGDFRPPDLMRFGIAPLYTRFTDALDAADALAEVLRTRAFERPAFRQRAAVP